VINILLLFVLYENIIYEIKNEYCSIRKRIRIVVNFLNFTKKEYIRNIKITNWF